jgi:photosystem II stability/assembly factor-like uncharacterized protein
MVATVGGIVTLEREDGQAAGPRWKITGNAMPGAHISSIIFPAPGLILAGIFKGGIAASTDGGSTWSARDAGVGERDVYSLAMTTLGGRTRLFAGTEPAHLYISDDLGQSWRDVPSLRAVPGMPRWTFPAPPHIGHLKHMTIAPDDPATIYASIEQGGLLKSTDGGESWQELEGVDEDVHRSMIIRSRPNRIYAVTGIGLYVSEDRGRTWERRTDQGAIIGGYPDQFEVVPSRPDTIFACGALDNPNSWLASHFAASRITRSRDAGLTWEILGNGLPAPERWQAAIEAMCIEDWGKSFSIFAGTTAGEVYASDDGGENWSLIAGGLAPISKSMHAHILNAA